MVQRSGGKLFARLTMHASVALIVVGALVGCTSTGGTGIPTPLPDDTTSPSTTATATASEAIITIAAVDVDGLNATVAGYVSGVEVDGANCEFVLAPVAGATPEVSVAGVSAANIKTTSCGTHQVPIDQLSKGTWTVVLHFVSDELDVESAPFTMEVP